MLFMLVKVAGVINFWIGCWLLSSSTRLDFNSFWFWNWWLIEEFLTWTGFLVMCCLSWLKVNWLASDACLRSSAGGWKRTGELACICSHWNPWATGPLLMTSRPALVPSVGDDIAGNIHSYKERQRTRRRNKNQGKKNMDINKKPRAQFQCEKIADGARIGKRRNNF